MKPTLLLALGLVCLLTGCEPVPHYNRVQGASLTGQPAKLPVEQRGKVRPYGSVKLFQSKDEVTRKYEIVGIMTVGGKPQEEAAFIQALLYRAADMGADAIILYRIGTTTDIKGSSMGFVSGGPGGFGGGFGSSIDTTHEAYFRAEAIQFQ